MSKLRIGYVPNSMNLGHPADRRRIVYWAKNRGHEIVLDLESNYDVLFLSGRADLTRETTEKNRSPIILDLVDGYLGDEQLWKDWLRGVGKVLTGQNSGTPRTYRKIVSEACQLANAVVCETVEQRETILPFCSNTHAILDFHEEFPLLAFNRDLQIRNFPALMWEGLPFTAKGLLLLRETLTEIAKTKPISLEIVTDLSYPLILGKYFHKPTQKILKDIPEILGEDFKLIKWTVQEVVESAKRSHISVLPLDPTGTLNPLKAENRLLIMWRLGLPTITSHSLAYSRVMRDSQIDGICTNSDEWQEKIFQLMDSVEYRKELVEKGQQYIRDKHSKEKVLSAWDRLFESVL
jgi:glycosyltransferase involved in cell wall biosynthesis